METENKKDQLSTFKETNYRVIFSIISDSEGKLRCNFF